MSAWKTYTERLNAHGSTKRNATLLREHIRLNTKLQDSLSYQVVSINNVSMNVAIIDSDNLDEKIMYSLPGETFNAGEIVEWADHHWLITEKDAAVEVQTRVKLVQCNYLLKWIDDSDIIHEQWCVVEDGTKYMSGEYEDRDFVVTRGDSRIAITIGRNVDTVKFDREHRFLVDDPLSLKKNAYLLTKPMKAGKTYNNQGVFTFVLSETMSTDMDNFELSIADYYSHFPLENDNNNQEDNSSSNIGKEVWL